MSTLSIGAVTSGVLSIDMAIFKKISDSIRRMIDRLSADNEKDEAGRESTFFETGKRGNTTVTGSMKNGLKEGLWRYFDATGRLVMEEYYKEGKLNGIFSSYYISGKLFGFGVYSDDKRHGEFLIFNPDGSLNETRIYRNGELVQVHSGKGHGDSTDHWPDQIQSLLRKH